MKNQVLGIFFYLLYLLAMVKPLVPIIEYYANYEYIATVLCENKDKPYLECNGKCYLQKQLKEVNHNNHDHKSTVPQINLDDYPMSPLDQFSYELSGSELISQINYGSTRVTFQDFTLSLLKPPPQVVS
ncbi:MAG: hypothetical protein KBE41_04485 [Lutibacter sp.]|nr:hypothetical protein [Lutibacter sp.]MBP9600740.1 hypothetical protein [Lutibacter sp.]